MVDAIGRVLIVDDDRAIGRLTDLWVRHLGYATTVVHDGVAAIETAARERPDAILLDVRMPDMDGFEVCRRLRGFAELADVPVLFVTANAQESARAEASACGAFAFLEKPFDLERLRGELERVFAPQPAERS